MKLNFIKEQNGIQADLDIIYKERKNFPTHNYSPNF